MRSRSSRRNEIGERIGLGLHALYGEVLCEPLPDRFCELLGRFEEETKAAAARFPTARQDAPSPSAARAKRQGPGITASAAPGKSQLLGAGRGADFGARVQR